MTKFLNFSSSKELTLFVRAILIFNTLLAEYHPALSFPLGTAQPDKSLPVKIGLSFGSASTETQTNQGCEGNEFGLHLGKITQRNL